MANTPTRPYAKRSAARTARSSMDSTLDDTISPRLSLDWRTALDRVPDGGDPFANELDHTEWTVQKAEETDHTYTDTTRNQDVKVIGAIAPFLETRVASPTLPHQDSRRISYILPSKESYTASSPRSSSSTSHRQRKSIFTKRRLIVLVVIVAIFILCLTLGLLLSRQKKENSKSESSTTSEGNGNSSASAETADQQLATNRIFSSTNSTASLLNEAPSNPSAASQLTDVVSTTIVANGMTTTIVSIPSQQPEQVTETITDAAGAQVITTRVTVRQSVPASPLPSTNPPAAVTSSNTPANRPASPSPSPSPASPSPRGSISSSDRAGIMETYDYWRPRHGGSRLSWSDSLANRAQLIAEGCQTTSSNYESGDLVAVDPRSGAGAAQQWYYLPIGEDARSTSAASDFAQFVWKSTTSLGCGSFNCPRGTTYVCSHSPPGNVAGEFRSNVEYEQAY